MIFGKLPVSSYEYQQHATSDHTPLWLQINPAQQGGPKSFRFYNFWLKCKGIKEEIQRVWHITLLGYPQLQVVGKLKALKLALKIWLKKENINIFQRIKGVRDLLSEISSKSTIAPFSKELHKEAQRLQ